ncbi:MAG: hypothetical protein MZW92_21145 [Comamonadaceae bacterium]|nr:hypothetical protein [Comamonadaceae bacterium]
MSARVAGVPLLSICNAHWSPYSAAGADAGSRPAAERPRRAPAVRPGVPRGLAAGQPRALRRRERPAPATRAGAVPLAGRVLHRRRPRAVRRRARDVPARRRARHASPPGPIVWSPTLPRPPWWDAARRWRTPAGLRHAGRPVRRPCASDIARACRAAGLAAIMASAGRGDEAPRRSAVDLSRALPAGQRRRRGRTHRRLQRRQRDGAPALAQGRPVLGICSNLDQLLTMQAVVDAGAGLSLRASEATPQRLQEAVARLVGEPSLAAAAQKVRGWFSRHPALATFGAALDSL